MRTEKEVAELAEGFRSAIIGGIEIGDPQRTVPQLDAMRELLLWVMGAQNLFSEVVARYRANNQTQSRKDAHVN